MLQTRDRLTQFTLCRVLVAPQRNQPEAQPLALSYVVHAIRSLVAMRSPHFLLRKRPRHPCLSHCNFRHGEFALINHHNLNSCSERPSFVSYARPIERLCSAASVPESCAHAALTFHLRTMAQSRRMMPSSSSVCHATGCTISLAVPTRPAL